MAAIRILFVLATIFWTQCLCQNNLLPIYLQNTLNNAFQSCRSRVNPGLAVAVVKDGQVQFTHALGVKDKNVVPSMPVTTNTMFGLGALSQAFTNVLTLAIVNSSTGLRDKGVDTTLKNYFNYKGLFKHSYLRSRYATLLDLMTHRMGFENHKYLRLDETMTRDKLMLRVHNMDPKGRFRDSYYYNDLMYGIIAKISEDVSKRQWEDMVTKEILSPMNMMSTSFFTSAAFNPLLQDVAQGYVENKGALHAVPYEFLRKWTRFCGDSCVASSANDMAKFMLFLLGNGTAPGSLLPIVPADTFDTMFKPWNRIQSPGVEDYFSKAEGTPVSRTHTGIALGFKTGQYRGWNMLEQTGDLYGYSTMMTLFPQTKLGIFIAMSGKDDHDFFRTTLSSYIADLFHKETPWLNSTLLCSFPRPWKAPPVPKPDPVITEVPLQRPITDYVGQYKNSLYGTLNVVDNMGQLELHYGFVQYILKRKESKSPRFYMIPKGIYEHIFGIDTMKFREQSITNLIESANIDKFEDADFLKEGVPAPP